MKKLDASKATILISGKEIKNDESRRIPAAAICCECADDGTKSNYGFYHCLECDRYYEDGEFI